MDPPKKFCIEEKKFNTFIELSENFPENCGTKGPSVYEILASVHADSWASSYFSILDLM